jgi:hypothetical protein
VRTSEVLRAILVDKIVRVLFTVPVDVIEATAVLVVTTVWVVASSTIDVEGIVRVEFATAVLVVSKV